MSSDISASISGLLAELLKELKHCRSMAGSQGQRFAHCTPSSVVLEYFCNVGISSLCTITHGIVARTSLKISSVSATSMAYLLTYQKLLNEARSRWDSITCSISLGRVPSVESMSLLLGEKAFISLSG
jgi:hypothetical protein